LGSQIRQHSKLPKTHSATSISRPPGHVAMVVKFRADRWGLLGLN
jgi:hypothetical protein